MKIGGILENSGLTLYRVATVKDRPGAAGAILKFYAQRSINLEYITESGSSDGRAVITVCIKKEYTEEVDRFIAENSELLQPYIIEKIENLSTISIYGPHFREKHSIAARFCRVLGAFGVNILGLSASISSICAVIKTCELEKTKEAVLKKFEIPG